MEIVIKRQGDYVKKSQNSKLKYNCQNIGGLSNGLKSNAFSKTIKKRIMTLGQGSRLNLPKQQEVEKMHKISRKKYIKKKTGENPEFIKCTKKEISNKAKKIRNCKNHNKWFK